MKPHKLSRYCSKFELAQASRRVALSDKTSSTATFCTLRLKKVPTIKLSITLSSLNRFSKNLYCWKAYEICYKTNTTISILP